MRTMNTKSRLGQVLQAAGLVALGSMLSLCAHAAAPGMMSVSTAASGSTPATDTFYLNAADTHITQPDGTVGYTWG